MTRYYPPSSKSGSDVIGSQAGISCALQKRVLATGYDEPTRRAFEMDEVKGWRFRGSFCDCLRHSQYSCIDDKRYATGFLIKTDHHPNDDAYGDLLWVDLSKPTWKLTIALFAKGIDLSFQLVLRVFSMLGLSAIQVSLLSYYLTRAFTAAYLRSIPLILQYCSADGWSP